MFSISLNVSFSQSKIKNEYFVRGLIESHTKVIRLDISVDEVTIVDVFNPRDHLIDKHKDGFERELT